MKKKEILNEMLTNNVHLGHKKNKLNQSMKNYVINIHKKIHIINLEITIKALKDVEKLLKEMKKNKREVLIVCVEKKTKKLIELTSKKVNMPYVNKRWLGGTLTNFKTLKTAINNTNYIKMMIDDSVRLKIKKKRKKKYIKKYKRSMSFLKGLMNIKKLPSFLFVINIKKNKNAIKEAKKMNIKTIAIADTNNYVENIDYIIPGNDDSYKSLFFFINKFSKMLK